MPVRGDSRRPVRLRPALDEIFQRMPARHHGAEILGEHHRIQRIALEAAAQEERAPFSGSGR